MSITLNTGQIITVGMGTLACDIGEVYKALDALTGDNLFTHQLPRALAFARPFVLEAYPWVNDLPPMPNLDGLDRDNARVLVSRWIDQISARHGATHQVPDLSGQWVHFDPLDEAAAIFGGKEGRHVDQ